MEAKGQIYTLIPKVMASIGAVGKNRKNPQQGYQFRGIDDLYNALNAALADHGVFTVPTVLNETREERRTKSDSAMFYCHLTVAYDFYAPDGSSVRAVVVGEGSDMSDKSSNKALAGAHKYALLQTFCIPTEEPKDSELDSHEVQARAAAVERTLYQNIFTEIENAPTLEDLRAVWTLHIGEMKTLSHANQKMLAEAKEKRKLGLTPKPAAESTAQEPIFDGQGEQKPDPENQQFGKELFGEGDKGYIPGDKATTQLVNLIPKAKTLADLNNIYAAAEKVFNIGEISKGQFDRVAANIGIRAAALSKKGKAA